MKEVIQENMKEVTEALKEIPELEGVVQVAKLETKSYEIAHTYIQYLRLVKVLTELTPEDIAVFREASEILKESRADKLSASHMDGYTFLNTITEDQRLNLVHHLSQSADPSSQYYHASLDRLAEMMLEGHKMKEEGGTPKDGDPRSDNLIWGHTVINAELGEEALIHFTIGHLMERFIVESFGKAENIEDLQGKDSFLSVITDVIAYKEALEPGSSRVYDIWTKPKDQGGLGWLKEDRVAAFREAITRRKARENEA